MREFCHDYHVVAIDMRFACMLCVYVCTCVCLCACMCVCMCVHSYMYASTCTSIFICCGPSFLRVHICMCCRGYGETEKPPLTTDYKIQKLAQDIAQLVSFYMDLGL